MTSRFLSMPLAAALLAAAAVAPAQAAIANFQFDSTPDSAVSVPLLGSGTFSFDGTPVGNSTVALSALSNVAFNFTVGGFAFSLSDLVTPLANIQVRFTTSGQDLRVSFGGSGGGPQGGSADFRKSSAFLSFQPGFGNQHAFSSGTSVVVGNYIGLITGVAAAAAPEPLPLALVALGLVAMAGMRRRAA